MTLAELIYKALHNPQYRLALETGTLSIESEHLSADIVAAAAEALRFSSARGRSNARGLLDEIFDINALTIPGWRT